MRARVCLFFATTILRRQDVLIREFEGWLREVMAARASVRVLVIVTPSSLFRAVPELRLATRLMFSVTEWLDQVTRGNGFRRGFVAHALRAGPLAEMPAGVRE